MFTNFHFPLVLLAISIQKYNPDFASVWNQFVVDFAKNSTFIFHRDFMEYHKERFADCSLLIFSNEKLVAVFPANFENKVVFSHGGLSYGGLIFRKGISSKLAQECWEKLVGFYESKAFEKLIYKPIPAYYHLSPTHEDAFSLFQLKAKTVQVKYSSVIEVNKTRKYQTRKRRNIRKAEKTGLEISPTSNLAVFWEILTENLWNIHEAKPVHSLPKSLRLFPNSPKTSNSTLPKKRGIFWQEQFFSSPKRLFTRNISSTRTKAELAEHWIS